MSLLTQDPVTKSIQKTIISDKEHDGIAGSNNIADKEKFALLGKWKYKVVGRKKFREKSNWYYHEHNFNTIGMMKKYMLVA